MTRANSFETGDGLAELIRRLDRLESLEEIRSLIAAYGPAVDSGSASTVGSLWATDGSYTFTDGGVRTTLLGRAGVEEMVDGSHHQAIIAGGSAHVLSPPVVELDGDRATVVGYSLLVRHDAATSRFFVDRTAANRWELRRGNEGWQVERRTNELLDGHEEARALLRSDPPREDPGRCDEASLGRAIPHPSAADDGDRHH